MRAVMLCVALLGGGCLSHAEKFGPFKPVAVTCQGSADDLYKRVMRVLSDRGLSTATSDKDAGVVVSEWESSTLMGTEYRYRWRVTVDDGRVVVTSDGQYRMVDEVLGTGKWQRLTTDQPNERMDGARALAADISATSPGV